MSREPALDIDLPRSSKEYKREYNRLYRLEHPEVQQQAQKKYRENNREKVLESGREYMRRIRKENPGKVHNMDRKVALSKRYNITVEEYNELLQKQGGVCATCGCLPDTKNGYLCVDHDHETGRVRGLLCRRCNVVLGQVNDNMDILQSLIDYLSDS